jgi:cysteine desulfurase / selenocysteine lyase
VRGNKKLGEALRADFPQLKRLVRDKRLVYLDSAATTLKPVGVIEAVRESMSLGASNVHRGAHYIGDEVTGRFEKVREKARKFVGAGSASEIIFTRGTTEGMNLIAQTLGKVRLKAGDEILLSQMEHHSNIVPWQMIAQEKQAKVRFIPVNEDGSLDLPAGLAMISEKTRIVSLVHLSNALGTINPVAQIFKAAKEFGAFTVLDAAQSIAAFKVDVTELGCDFLAFSAHKIFGPTGVGLLYGRLEILESLPPYQGGGSMISEVRENGVDFLPPPNRFEAGTPAIAEVMGFGAALDYVGTIGFEEINQHDQLMMARAEAGLREIQGVRRIGTAEKRSHVISFLLEGSHPSDVGAILDEQGVAVRAGHHCCQPLMRRYGIPGTVRASFSIYTSEEDVEQFLGAVRKAKDLLL